MRLNKKLILFITIAATIVACKDVVNELPNTPFSTTLYKLEIPNTLPPANYPADNLPTEEGVYLGRMLFYDPVLSADSTQSCSSCHNQALAFTDNGEQFSTGIKGLKGKRNAMPIFNLQWHLDGFFWDGRADILRHQAIMPIRDPLEMDETIGNLLVKLNSNEMYKEHFKKAFNADQIDEELVGKALEQFMNIIISGNSKFDRVSMGLESFTDQEKVGQLIFNAEAKTVLEERDPKNPQNFGADCFHCHGNSLFMRRELLNNGLDSVHTDLGYGGVTGNATDNGKFKTPSLRNIEKTAPYMHDGRFKTLEEVIDFYLSGSHGTSPNLDPSMHALQYEVYLSPEHKAALVSFLMTLTDDTYLTNKEYSNPFK
jgi:cytochrome c peroxidase